MRARTHARTYACRCWDTSFAIQAMAEGGLCEEFPELTARVYSYLERTQILCTDTARASPAFRCVVVLFLLAV